MAFVQEDYPVVSVDSVQVGEVQYYARQLINLTDKKEELVKK